MGAYSYLKTESSTNQFEKENWIDILDDLMQMQYHAGNLKGYLDYKKFLDFLN